MEQRDIAGLPKGTKCLDCIYLIARIIEPLDEEDIEDTGAEDEIFVQTSCLLLDIDVHDHMVRECSKYEKYDPNLLIDQRFLGMR